MAEKNVIREDVVRISYEVKDNPFKGLNEETKKFKENVTQGTGAGTDGLKKTAEETKKTAAEMKKLKKEVSEALISGFKKAEDAAGKALSKMNSGIKKVAGGAVNVMKKVGVAVAGAATGFAALATKAVSSYANFEQQVGGIETLFKDSKDTMIKYANDAYKTAGLSANEYMETTTSFAASLLQSVKGDTAKAAALANQAVIDMSDNANKMGTDMESIQNAYQGFAKQNYTMLDNLKLGYGGTKEEMARLIKDAAKMKDVQKELGITVNASSMDFANIVNAIHVMQTSLGIAGTTSKEASTTISGSINSMKAAWSNFLTGMADPNQDFDQLVGNLVDSVVTVAKNIIPRIKIVVPRLAQGLREIFDQAVGMVDWGAVGEKAKNAFPKVVAAVANGFRSILTWVRENKDMIIAQLANAGAEIARGLYEGITGKQMEGDMFAKIKDSISGLINFVTSHAPGIIKAFAAIYVACAGAKFIGGIVKVVTTVKKGVDLFNKIKTLMSGMGILTKVLSGIKAGFTALTGPIGLTVIAIVAVIAAIVLLVKNWDKVKEVAGKVWNWIKETWSKLGDWFSSSVVAPVKKCFSSMWASVKNTVGKVKTNITDAFQEAWDKVTGVWNGLKDFFSGIWDGLKGTKDTLKKALLDVWKNAVKAVAKPINKLIDGANWILGKLDPDAKMKPWEPYAKGTKGHKGGNAMVNDGRGAELVVMPNGRAFIPRGRNVLLPAAPKGMKVLDAQRTAKMMGRSSPTFNYKDGTGFDFDIWDFFDDAKGLVGKVIKKYINYDGMFGYPLDVAKAVVSKAKEKMFGWVKNLFGSSGGKSIANYNPSKGVEQWRSVVEQALKMEGLFSDANVKRTLYQMQTESGGNPRAINLWDVNARRGTPSKGLMQVIDPTFKTYAAKGHNKDIYDPLSNVLASIRYAKSTYGSLAKAYRGVGYASGIGFDNSGRIEYSPSANPKVNASTVNETYAPQFNLTISGSSPSDRELERKVRTWVIESMNEVFESMSRRNPRLTEV